MAYRRPYRIVADEEKLTVALHDANGKPVPFTLDDDDKIASFDNEDDFAEALSRMRKAWRPFTRKKPSLRR